MARYDERGIKVPGGDCDLDDVQRLLCKIVIFLLCDAVGDMIAPVIMSSMLPEPAFAIARLFPRLGVTANIVGCRRSQIHVVINTL